MPSGPGTSFGLTRERHLTTSLSTSVTGSVSLSKGDSVDIVIVDCYDSPTGEFLWWNDDEPLAHRFLPVAVETAGHPDTYTLFVQKKGHRPHWVDSKLPRSTLMQYPQSDVMRSQFWKALTTLIG